MNTKILCKEDIEKNLNAIFISDILTENIVENDSVSISYDVYDDDYLSLEVEGIKYVAQKVLFDLHKNCTNNIFELYFDYYPNKNDKGVLTITFKKYNFKESFFNKKRTFKVYENNKLILSNE